MSQMMLLRSSHRYPRVRILVFLLISGLIILAEGCRVRDDIATYLVAGVDGEVDVSRLHTPASSRIIIDPAEVIVSFRRYEQSGEIFDIQLACFESSQGFNTLRINRFELVGVNGSDLDHPVVLKQTRSIGSGKSGDAMIANYKLDISKLSEPATLKLRIGIEADGENGELLKEAVFTVVRTEAEIPTSYR